MHPPRNRTLSQFTSNGSSNICIRHTCNLLRPPRRGYAIRSVRLSFCLSVYRITVKVINRFHWNLVLWLGTNRKNCSTFGGVRSRIRIPDHFSIYLTYLRNGNFRRFTSISRTVSHRPILQHSAKRLTPTRQWIHNIMEATRQTSASGLIQKSRFESRITSVSVDVKRLRGGLRSLSTVLFKMPGALLLDALLLKWCLASNRFTTPAYIAYSPPGYAWLLQLLLQYSHWPQWDYQNKLQVPAVRLPYSLLGTVPICHTVSHYMNLSVSLCVKQWNVSHACLATAS